MSEHLALMQSCRRFSFLQQTKLKRNLRLPFIFKFLERIHQAFEEVGCGR